MTDARFSWRNDLENARLNEPLTTEASRDLTSIVGNAWSTDDVDLDQASVDRWPPALRRRHLGLKVPRPTVVIWPTTAQHVSDLFQWSKLHGIALVTRGAGSGVVGGAVPLHGEAVLSTERMNAIVAFDPTSGLVRVEAGVMGGDLETWLNQRDFTLGHYPQSIAISTVGGWVATRASGTFSSGYGNIEDVVRGLEVVVPGGDVLSFAPIPRSATGPNLRELFVGSEGTLGIVTQIDLQVRRLPESRIFDAFVFDTLGQGIEATRALAQSLYPPALVRLYDAAGGKGIIADNDVPNGGCPLILGWDGPSDIVEILREHSARTCLDRGGRAVGPAAATEWFDKRFDVSALERGIERVDGIADTIEIAASWSDAEQVHSAVVEALSPLCDRVSGHFSHVYPTGTSLYVVLFLSADAGDVENQYAEAWRVALEAALDAGASISHHHGIGLMRAGWMPAEPSTEVSILRDLKRLFDPQSLLNPGKLINTTAQHDRPN
ncbi:MAG: FAD-binding oxidoreductase [Actinomycetia bacterium]|nr:FAD-binding oxidoreductase [Actinomycetes bacterium]